MWEDAIHPESRYSDWLGWKNSNNVLPVKLNDKSNSGIDVPNRFLFTIHYRFSTALRWLHIAQILVATSDNTNRIRNSSLPHRKYQFIKNLFHTTWLKTPQLLRLQVYKALAFWGAFKFKPIPNIYGSAVVQKLPLNMYLKRCMKTSLQTHMGPPRRYIPEFKCLQVIREHTSIPVPRPIDIIQTPTDLYMLISQVPGDTVSRCIDLCSEAETDQLVDDLQYYFNELRSIPNPFARQHAICNSLGEGITSWPDDTGPFATEAEYNEAHHIAAVPSLVQPSGHELVYTHGDLHMMNILMKNGRITGFVDWETAGWYPYEHTFHIVLMFHINRTK